MRTLWIFVPLLAVGGVLAGCATGRPKPPPLRAVDFVDIPRFMGDWWVIAHIPWFAERDTYDSRDTYRLRDDGKIDNIFSFRKGGFDGPEKVLRGVGWVVDHQSNAEWRVQFLWPFALPYYVIYLDPAYRFMAVGHPSRNYAWVMARDQKMSPSDYAMVLASLEAQGFDIARLRKVPQSGRGLQPAPQL